MAATWFERFGDIPAVQYSPLVTVSRSSLAGSRVRPTSVRDYDGKPALRWEDSIGSKSPAWAYAFEREISGLDEAGLIRHISEALELPGEPADYHFAIQRVCEELWKRRKAHPDVLADLERLCWIDIALVQAVPSAVAIEGDRSRRFVTIRAFGYLSTLYEREGAWHEALAVAELAERYDQPGNRRDDLAERVAALSAEESG